MNNYYFKKFDKWALIKEEVDQKNVPENLYFYEKEVWWCIIGLNIGTEINGKDEKFQRPVLIIKKFNKYQFWGIPLTSKNKNNKYSVSIIYLNNDKKIKSFLNLSQLKVFSAKRLTKKIGLIEEINFKEILENIKSLL